MNINDSELEKISEGAVELKTSGIPGALNFNMNAACEYFLKKQAAISDAKHCGLCQFFTAIPSQPTYGQCGCPSVPKAEFEAHELV